MKELPGRGSGVVLEVSSGVATVEGSVAKDVEEIVEEEITVRQWLSGSNRVVERLQCLHVFKQVLDFVHLAHGQGVMLRNIRPSCFLLSPLNKVAFIDSANSRSSSDQSCGTSTGKGSPSPERVHGDAGVGRSPPAGIGSRLPERSGSTGSEEERRAGASRGEGQSSEMKISSSGKERVDVSSRNDEDCFPQRESLHMEHAWYSSPEEHATGTSSFASDIYSLGVLMFEVGLLTGHLDHVIME